MVRMASAAEYVIDFSMITDFERLRPLIEPMYRLRFLGAEQIATESVSDLESLREFLERIRVAP